MNPFVVVVDCIAGSELALRSGWNRRFGSERRFTSIASQHQRAAHALALAPPELHQAAMVSDTLDGDCRQLLVA